MGRAIRYMGKTVKSFIQSYREAAKQAEQNSENQGAHSQGYHEFRETDMGPLPFGNGTFPRGTHLLGVMTEVDYGIRVLKKTEPGRVQDLEDLVLREDEERTKRVPGAPVSPK